MLTFIFIGVALFQIIFIFYQYILFKRVEFIYYLLYSIFITVFCVANLLPQYNPFTWMITDKINFILGRGILFLAYGFYYLFGLYFTQSNILYPKFFSIINFAAKFILTIGFLDIILQIAGVDYIQADNYFFKWFMFSILIFSVYVIGYLITRKNVLTKILVFGSFMLLVGASVGLIDSLFITKHMLPEVEYIPYIEFGIILEFLFLTFGLIYKTKLLTNENYNLLVKQQNEIEDERQRIIAELHDDLGSSISALRIMSEIIKNPNLPEPKKNEYHEKIASTTKQISEQMKEIVWSFDNHNDNLLNITDYIKNYGDDFFSGTSINYKFVLLNECLKNNKVSGLWRKNVLLIIKEILNNALKHSQAKNIQIQLGFFEKYITITITDDGIGFENNNLTGNGLNNIERRIAILNGTINCQSKKGTQYFISIPFD